jgi:hypothetical protein
MTEKEVSPRAGQRLPKIAFQGPARYDPSDILVIGLGTRRVR